MQPLFLLAILFSVLLVSTKAAHLNDESLPSLIIEDSPQASLAEEKAPSVDGVVNKEQQVGEKQSIDVNSKEASVERLIPYSTTTTTATSNKEPDEPLIGKANKEASTSQAGEQVVVVAKSEPRQTDNKVALAASEKDINALLANKDDAENDLAASPANGAATSATAATDPKPSSATEVNLSEKKSTASSLDLDAPVEVNSDKGMESNDRFHYSLAGSSGVSPQAAPSASPDAAAPPSAASADADRIATETLITTTTATATTLKPAESSAASTEQPVVSSTTIRDLASGSEAPSGSSDKTGSQEPATKGIEAEESPKIEPVEPVKPVVSKLEPAPEAQEAPRVEPVVVSEKGPEAAVLESKKDNVEVVSPKREESAKSEPAPEVTTAAAVAAASIEPKKEVKPANEKEADKPTVSSESSIAKPVESQEKKEAAATTTSVKPAEMVPSVAAAAAAGAAAGSALAGAIIPPLRSEGPKATSTTRAPFSLRKGTPAPPTPKRSFFDIWGTSTTSIPVRTRPIFNSIGRRRYRPHHSGYPWGVDVYNPYGGLDDESVDHRDERQPASGSRAKDSSSRHKGNSSTSTTTEAPKRGSSGEENADDDDDNQATETPQPPRRRPEQGSKRRHQHHQHQHRHHQHHSRKPYDGPRRHYSPPSSSTWPGRRYGSQDRELGSSPSFPFGDPFSGGSQADASRPFSAPPGFGLFNSGATGSGFDLLNPLSWLNPAGSGSGARPSRGGAGSTHMLGTPSRQPGSRPVPSEGEYNESSSAAGNRDYEHEHDYHEHHHRCDEHARRPSRPHGDRPYGERPYGDRPYGDRPYGDRPYGDRPYGGERPDYDTYPPSRPGRPYNRRDSSTQSPSIGGHREPLSDDSDTIIRDATDVSPSLYSAKRENPNPNPTSTARRTSNIFSPFESLFKDIDEDIFSLRSSLFEPTRVSSGNIGGS